MEVLSEKRKKDYFTILHTILTDDTQLMDNSRKLFKELIFDFLSISNFQANSYYSALSLLQKETNPHWALNKGLHLFRKYVLEEDNIEALRNETPDVPKFVRSVILGLVELVTDSEIPSRFNEYKAPLIFSTKTYEKFYEIIFCTCQEIWDHGKMKVFSDELGSVEAMVNLSSQSLSSFEKQLEDIKRHINLPVTINLLNVKIYEDKVECDGFVLLPDFLIDITTVASCFGVGRNSTDAYLINKFHVFETSLALLKGLIINDFLDLLINDPEIEFSDQFSSIFEKFGLQLSLYDDEQIKELIPSLKNQFHNLKTMVQDKYRDKTWIRDEILLEPSFYSKRYGLQGRLDLLVLKNNASEIIELKSGKLFMPNKYGLNTSHYMQTLLYYTLTKSTILDPKTTSTFILYSRLNEDALRFAPQVKTLELEAMYWRNEIIIWESKFDQISDGDNLLDYLEINELDLRGFHSSKYAAFKNAYVQLNPLEKAYINCFLRFLTKEYHISKLGRFERYQASGQAALWNASRADKMESYSLMDGLYIESQQISNEDHFIRLKFSEETPLVTNFRVGDVVVLYPDLDGPILNHQILKSSITSLDEFGVEVRLRSKQSNLAMLEEALKWAIEADFIESSFSHSFRSFHEWMQSSSHWRHVILGLITPRKEVFAIDKENIIYKQGATAHQQDVIVKALQAQDYFLIWGPPGTGKTSMILSSLVANYARNSKQKVLIAAYTNRAVDEIFEAITCTFSDIKNIVRIGSEYSVDDRFKHYLLKNKLNSFSRRDQVVKYFQQTQFVVGTVASLLGKPELFAIFNFDVAIVDEASQILEPQILPLLSKVNKYILIGDHTQLPAVVMQNERESKVEAPIFQKVGLTNCRNSYFERLFKLCKRDDRSFSYAVLREQGRMTKDIMNFVSREYYEEFLTPIHHCTEPLDLDWQIRANDFSINEHQVQFIDSGVEASLFGNKSNDVEANIIVKIVEHLIRTWDKSDLPISEMSFGIVTTFRAQIANIKNRLNSTLGTAISNLINVDTVERYQGSARDVILYSCVVNSISQMEQISSLSEDGKDRKLNVVVSRARKLLIIVGNEEVLRTNDSYRHYIEYCKVT